MSITVNADDSNGTISGVRFYIDGKGVDFIAVFPFTYFWDTEEVDLGTHTIRAEAIDNDGLSASDEISVRIIESSEIDTISVTIEYPENDEKIEHGELVNIYVETDDKNGIINEVRFYINGFGVSSSTEYPYSYEWNTAVTDIGIHTITVEARDDSGPVASDEINVQIIESDSVVATIKNPVDNEEIEQGAAVVIYVELEDEDEKVNEIRFYIDGLGVSTAPSFPYTFFWNTEGVAIGMHTIRVEAIDDGESITSDEINVEIIESEIETVSVSIVDPVNNEEFEQGEEVSIFVELDDEGDRVSEVRFYIDGIGVGTSTSFPYTYDWNTDGADLGMHTIRVEVLDDIGPIDTDEISIQIIESTGI